MLWFIWLVWAELCVCELKEVLCWTGVHTVEGVAVDWMANNLYWTDDGPKKSISVARLEKAAQTKKILIEGNMSHPRAIVVDPKNGYEDLEGGKNLLLMNHIIIISE